MTDAPADCGSADTTPEARPPVLPPPKPWQRNLVFGTIGFTIVLGWIGDALSPSLVDDHPLVLIALNAKPRYQLATVNQLDAWTYYTFTTFRLLCTKPLVWLVGAWYGHRAVEWAEGRSERGGRILRWVERHFARWGWVAITITSNNVMCLLAGSAGFSLGWFMVVAVVGTLLRLLAVDIAGEWLAEPIDTFIRFVSAHSVPATAITITLVVGMLVWQHRRGRGALQELHDFEQAMDEPQP